MKRFLSLAAAAAVMFNMTGACMTAENIGCVQHLSAFAAGTADSGAWGENITWTLSSDGTLTVSGKGAIPEGKLTYVIVDLDAAASAAKSRGAERDSKTPSTIGGRCNELWKSHQTDIRKVVIGKGITEIGLGAFCGLTNLTDVTLPETLTAIDEYAFANCANMTRPAFPETLTECAYSAFWNCDAFFADDPFLLSIDGKTLIAYGGSSTTLTELPESVTTIGRYAFAYNLTLTSVSISDTSVTTIQDGAFKGCGNLQSIVLPDRVTALKNSLFHGCTLLESIKLPARLKSIGEDAFAYNTALKEITLPETLRTIGAGAFQYCTVLQEITLPDALTKLPDHLFFKCYKLQKVHLPDAVTYISPSAFTGCTLIRSAYRQANGMTIIEGKVLFTHHIRLAFMDVPDTVITIADEAWDQANHIVCLTIPPSVQTFGQEYLPNIVEIRGTPGTPAETFAKENGVPFRDVAEPEPEGKDNSIIYGTDTWSLQNGSVDFGDTYYLTDTARSELLSHMATGAGNLDDPFSGACFGLSVTMLLAKAGILKPSQIQPGAKTLSDIKPDNNVRSVINYYHFLQNSQELLALATESKTELQITYRAIQSAKAVQHGGSPFLISLALKSYGHAVVGYGQEDGNWKFEGETYDGRILVWDPNFPTAPNEDTYIYYNSETLSYCIPYYDTYVEGGDLGVLKRICSDTDTLNVYPYPFTGSTATGDVNADGKFDAKDPAALQSWLLKTGKIADWKAGDIDGNGKLNAADLTLMKQMLL